MTDITDKLIAEKSRLKTTCTAATSFLFLHEIEKPDRAANSLFTHLQLCWFREQDLIKNVTTLTSTVKALKKTVSAYNSAKVKKQYVDYERQKETTKRKQSDQTSKFNWGFGSVHSRQLRLFQYLSALVPHACDHERV